MLSAYKWNKLKLKWGGDVTVYLWEERLAMLLHPKAKADKSWENQEKGEVFQSTVTMVFFKATFL